MAQGLNLSVGRIDLSLITFWERYKLLFPFFCGCIIFPLYLFPFLSGYDPSKWLLLYIFSSISFLLMIPGNSLYVPSLSRVQKFLLIGVGLILAFNYFYHGISFLGKETVDRLMFWALFFFYCSCLKEVESSEKADLFYALFLGTGLFIVGGFFNFIFIKPQLSFSFGNLNKAAEFVGFSLAIQLGLLSSYSEKVQKWLILLISLSIAYLYFAKCRSAWIGTTFVFAYLLWIKKIPIKTLLSIILITLLLIGGGEIIFLSLGDVPLNLSAKDGSFYVRWHLLLNTVFLFIDHPLGIGLGRFGFAAVPYMKTLPYNVFTDTYYLSSPFNEPLRFLAEEGVIVGVTLFLFFASFFFPFQKIKTMSTHCPESGAFLIFLLVQSVFQYPLSQPFVLFLLPFVLAYTCRYTIRLQFVRVPLFPWFKRGLGIFFCFATLAMGISIYLSTIFSLDTRLSKSVYFFWKDQNLLNTILFMSYVNKDYEKTKQLALKELEREPQNKLALKYLGLANLRLGNVTQGCAELKAYEQAYVHPSTVFEESSNYCEQQKKPHLDEARPYMNVR